MKLSLRTLKLLFIGIIGIILTLTYLPDINYSVWVISDYIFLASAIPTSAGLSGALVSYYEENDKL